MQNYNKRTINILAFILSIISLMIIHFLFINYQEKLNLKMLPIQVEDSSKIILKTSLMPPSLKEKNKIPITLQELKDSLRRENVWSIKIKKINLEAPIQETTSLKTMKQAIGHFEETSTWNGNVGLAAHNRGYLYNYFERLKELQKGDEIVYRTKEGKRKYRVEKVSTISENDWSNLQPTKENKITLITCIENMPEYRLCVQAIQI